jgi:hypothetical protein
LFFRAACGAGGTAEVTNPRNLAAAAALRVTLAAALTLALAGSAAAQLRIVSYNTTGAPRTGIDFVLRAIGQELKAGVANRPIDVLLLQEQDPSAGLPDTQAFVTLLNGIYAGQGLTYARSTLIGGGGLTQTLVYKTNSIQLMDQLAFGTVSTSAQARQTMRYKVKPVGYDDSAAFYLYNSHYKSSATAADEARRLVEATAIRANSDALGEGVHAIYAGDHNFYDASDEPAVAKLMSAGAGRAVDPINRVGDWSNNSAFKDVHTQSPTTTVRDPVNYGGQVIGGLDDRFDFQWVTDELMDGEGLSYISGSYHTFGNNGTTYNTDIDAFANTYPFDLVTFSGAETRQQLLTNLASVTDHLPVVADYRIPAKMGVQIASIPSTVNLGSIVPINVAVENIAPVLQANFADELDYTISVTGALTGGVTSLAPAASGPANHDVFLDTSTPGLKNGLITVMSTSQQASSPLFTFPVSFNVLAAFLAADFNEDGAVDATDLTAWSTNFGLGSGALKAQGDADVDGDVDGADFLTWQQQLGQLPGSAIASGAVPEPATAGVALVAVAFLMGVRRRA